MFSEMEIQMFEKNEEEQQEKENALHWGIATNMNKCAYI